MRHYLYRHIRPDTNQVFYVGIGTKGKKLCNTFENEYKRAFKKHSRSSYWHNVYEKCNRNYEVEILLESDDYDWLEQKEIEFIALYGRENLGLGTLVNLTDGGDGNRRMIMPGVSKKKMSESHKGKRFSEEHKMNLSRSLSGQKRTPEQRAAVSRGARNRKTVKPVLQYDIEGNFINEWRSVRDACEGLGYDKPKSGIFRCCNGYQNTALEFIWKWKTNEN